ncbi:MAG: sulfur carrier protein ThiS [Phycisphaeraceae bacterium]
MEVTVNGQMRQVRAGSVGELLAELGLAGQPVAVELNEELVPKARHEATGLTPGDRLELVTLVGGG